MPSWNSKASSSNLAGKTFRGFLEREVLLSKGPANLHFFLFIT